MGSCPNAPTGSLGGRPLCDEHYTLAAGVLGTCHDCDQQAEILFHGVPYCAFHLDLATGDLGEFITVNGQGDGEDPGPIPPEVDLDEADELDPSLYPIDLGPWMKGDATQPQPTILARHDHRRLFYEQAVNGVHGASGEGKGWVAVYTIAELVRDRRTSLILDYEDVEASWAARMVMLGITADDADRYVIYIRPQVKIGPRGVDHLKAICTERDVCFVVVDSVGEVFGIEGIDENSDAEVGPWFRHVPRQIAEHGPAVLVVDHSTKAHDNPLYPSGSKRKRAAITGASYLAEATIPFVKATAEKAGGGRLRLTCAKDRHGNYRRGEVAANLVMQAPFEDVVELNLWAPTKEDQGDGDPVAEIFARAAIKALAGVTGTVSGNALIGLIKDRGSAQKKWGGIDLAVSDGRIKETPGPGRRRLFSLPDPVDNPVIPGDSQ